MENDELFFEITDSGYFVRLEPLRLVREGSELDWDNNFVICNVSLRAGNFTGNLQSEFMTTEFEILKREIKSLFNNLNGTIDFIPLEGQIKLNINGDGIGHFKVQVIAFDQLNLDRACCLS